MIRVSDGVEGVVDSTIPPYPLTLGPGFDPVGGGLSGGPARAEWGATCPAAPTPLRWMSVQQGVAVCEPDKGF